MTPRLHWSKVAPDAYRAMFALETYARSTGLEPALYELVKLRASYANGCAFCVDMHSKDARADGETEQRIYAIPVWRETPFFTPRERAALAWTEAVTELGPHGVPDDIYAEASAQFSETELVHLTMCIIAINGWNRLGVAFRTEVGAYQPKRREDPAR
jgi:AhpD family alkylhydroperoxidase